MSKQQWDRRLQFSQHDQHTHHLLEPFDVLRSYWPARPIPKRERQDCSSVHGFRAPCSKCILATG